MARRKLDPRNTSLLALCVALGGYRKGTRVATLIMQWAIVSHQLGREPAVHEYVDWWKDAQSERSIRRHLAEFRELFPELATPQPFVGVVPEVAKLSEALTAAALAKVPPELFPSKVAVA